MYKELVMRLRLAKAVLSKNKDLIALLSDAADAIEQLTADLERSKEWETFWEKEANEALKKFQATVASMPRWIPVTERLPEEPYGCLAIVWDNNVMTGDTFLNYYPEYIGFDGESWNDCDGEEISLEVVYWMKMPKIPEPPKEET